MLSVQRIPNINRYEVLVTPMSAFLTAMQRQG